MPCDATWQVYHQYLVNIIAANLTRHVLPMRVPSFLGAAMLAHLGYVTDLLYLDSAHVTEKEDRSHPYHETPPSPLRGPAV